MTSVADLYDGYLAAANASDAATRAERLREVAVPDLEIISPFPYTVRGIDAVATKLAAVASAQPDGTMRLERTSDVDAHNGFFRVTFRNCNADGEPVSTGLHVIEMRDGLLSRIVVFVPDAMSVTG